MKIKEKHIPIGNLKAETFVNEMFPDDFPISVSAKSIFYSNYCEDLLEVVPSDYTANEVYLSRDGIFDLLPEGIFFNEFDYREARQKGKPFKPDKAHVHDLLSPFDTEYFRVTLGLDQMTRDFEQHDVEILMNELYGIEPEKIANPYCRAIAPLLLQASVIRGDFPLLARLLSAVTQCEATCTPTVRTRILKADKAVRYPFLNIIFNIPNLSNQSYLENYEQLRELVDFVAEWFFPAELEYDLALWDTQQPFVLNDNTLTLEYNTFL